MKPSVAYLMEDTREAARLATKVDAVEWVQKYCQEFLRESSAVLDVACGPGVLAAAVAHARPQSAVTGLDGNPDRFAGDVVNRPPNLSLLAGDVRAIPLADNTFDLVYGRLILEYVAERQQVVNEMFRVCKAGRTVLLQDLDGQLVWHYPEDPELQAMTQRVVQGLEQTGFDPFVGRKLFWLARSAGLRDLRVSAESYHLVAGRIDGRNFALWDTKLDIALPVITRIVGSETAARDLKRRFLNYLQRDDTLTYSVLFTLVGKKPG